MTAMQAHLTADDRSVLAKYRDLVIGSRRFWDLAKYELIVTLTSGLPGALGLTLRRVLMPCLLGAAGRGLVFGRNLTIRHPHRIRLGDRVIIDENCLLDGKGERLVSIEIGDGVYIGRNSILSVHNGYIKIGDHANIGAYCAIQSSGPIHIGDRVIMAAFCHIVSSSRNTDRTDLPIIAQGTTGVGITIGEGTWLGSGVIVTDGVTIGRHCVIGAGAVVLGDIPDYSVAVGHPARVIRSRRAAEAPSP